MPALVAGATPTRRKEEAKGGDARGRFLSRRWRPPNGVSATATQNRENGEK
jgi:hypothetical protein